MSIIFNGKIEKIGTVTVIRIPSNFSKMLPSRGMVMVAGTLNDVPFKAPLEPDGKGSHWLEVSSSLIKETEITTGEILPLNIKPIDDWFEPVVPKDLKDAIIKSDVLQQWNSVTVKARWDWIRWIRFTSNQEIRKKRIDVTCSKLKNDDKRPCCFDRTRCTITNVSKSGVLLDE